MKQLNRRPMKINLSGTLAVMLALTLTACTKSSEDAVPQYNEVALQDNIAQVRNYILKQGHSENNIVEQADGFVVEGDIFYSKNMQVSNGTIPRQLYSSLVSATKVKNIRLYIANSISGNTAEIMAALKKWNDVANCDINWTVVTSAPYDVQIYATDGMSACGRAALPSGGNPGSWIAIHTGALTYTSSKLTAIICHEMGHTVGLKHTDQEVGTPVPTVEGDDPLSIMKWYICGLDITDPSANDKKAVAYLY